MLYAPRPGSRRPPPPCIPAARSANCRPPVRHETELDSRPRAATVFCFWLYQPPHSEAPRGGGASKNGPVGAAGLASSALEFMRGSLRCASSPHSPSKGRASFGRPMVGEDRGGGSRRPTRRASDGAFDNPLRPCDPPPIGRSGERPSLGRAMSAPTRGGGCANDFAEWLQALRRAGQRRTPLDLLTSNCRAFRRRALASLSAHWRHPSRAAMHFSSALRPRRKTPEIGIDASPGCRGESAVFRVGVETVARLILVMALALLATACNQTGLTPSPVPNPVTGQNPGDVKYYPSYQPVRLGTQRFYDGNFGLAQQYFQDAVEKSPEDVMAWIGLAASYDRLGRFDLADHAYR